MLMCQHLVGLPTCDKVDDVILTEVLLDSEDSCESHHQLFLGTYLFLGMETVIAVATVFLVITLAEIMEQHLSTTHGCLGISCRFLK